MKLLALLGYPRRHGHTATLAARFLAGAEEAGAQIQRVDLPGAGIRACQGCYHCWTHTPGRCVQQDPMAALLQDLLGSDLVVVASPV